MRFHFHFVSPTDMEKIAEQDVQSEDWLQISKIIQKINPIPHISLENGHIVELHLHASPNTSIPEQVFELPHLEILNLCGIVNLDLFTTKKAKFQDSLLELDLSQCNLTQIPRFLADFSNLQKVFLSFNTIHVISNELSSLSQLHTLFLDHNHLTELSPQIFECLKLRRLNINYNPLGAVPFLDKVHSALQEFYCAHSQLTEIASAIEKLPNLTLLDLSHNSLSTLPETLASLKSLLKLDLSSNNLTSLPSQIGELNSLVSLDASNNNLKSLPETFGDFKKLAFLNLLDNPVQSLSKNFGHLATLTDLRISFNHFLYPWASFSQSKPGSWQWPLTFLADCKQYEEWNVEQLVERIQNNYPLTKIDKNHPDLPNFIPFIHERCQNVNTQTMAEFWELCDSRKIKYD